VLGDVDIRLTELPHGLLRRTETVQTCTASYHLVVVFGPHGPPEDLCGLWNETRKQLINNSPTMAYASSLFDRLHKRFLALTKPIGSMGGVAGMNGLQEHAGALRKRGLPVKDYNGQATGKTEQASTREKRGLITIVGVLGKQLFGLQTEQDAKELQKAITANRDGLEVISHISNKMLSIINVTRLQMIENRKSINDLIDVTKGLKDYLEKRTISYHLILKLQLLEISVGDLERERDRMFRMRKDLERGFLSEDMLPLDELRELANSPLIPKGNSFVTPIVWYYSNLKVHIMQVDEELVYSIDLPLVSEEHAFATQFKSFPAPNVEKNVTIQVDVNDSHLFKIHSNQVIKLPTECMVNDHLCVPHFLSSASSWIIPVSLLCSS
jgi:hypothetical protein